MNTRAPVITIDGPSGSGKGTLARRVAERYGLHLLDSGALYRITALQAAHRQVNPTDEAAIIDIARTMRIEFSPRSKEGLAVLLDGVDVSAELRGEVCATHASIIASMPALRTVLLDVQRAFRRPPGLVADGRDMGTVVFPDAAVKIFLTASIQERAQRRLNQLKEKGIETKITSLLAHIKARDERDQNRATAPLRAAGDAHPIDSTAMSIDAVEARIFELVDSTCPR